MALEEPVEVLVRAAVESEDVLAGVTDEEDLHGGVDLQEKVEDPVVHLGQVLGFVNDQDGHLVAEPATESVLAELLDEETEDVIDGDDVVLALELGNQLGQLGVPGLEPGFQAGLDLVLLVLVVELDAELLGQVLDVGVVNDDVVELLPHHVIVTLHHLEAEGVERPVVELVGLAGTAFEGGAAETLAELVGGGVRVGEGDNLLGGAGGTDIVEKLVDEEVGLTGSRTGAHVDDLGVAEHGVLLLVVEPGELVGAAAADVLHRGGIRCNLGCEIDKAYDHAVEGHIGVPVDDRVVVDHIIELVLQAEGSLGHLIVLVPLVELLQSVGESAVAARDLIVEIMRHGPHGLGLVRPVAVRLQVVILEHLVVFLYPFLFHVFVLR